MKLKICLLVAMLAVAAVARAATNDLTGLLQQGLFEEEANRDLNAAIANYQSLATAFDKDRQLAATAIFRLGECYRKLGKTNDAVAEYQRILKEFADQPTLVTLSRQNLTGLGVTPVSPTAASKETSVVDAEASVASLQAQLEAIDKMTHDQKAIYVQQNFPNPMLTTLMQELDLAQQDLIKLKVDYTPDHPKFKTAQGLVDDLKRKADAQLNGTIEGLRTKLAVAQVQAETLHKGRSASVSSGSGDAGALESQYALLKAKLAQARQETNNQIVAELFDDNKELAERLRIELSTVWPTESMLEEAKARGNTNQIENAEKNLKLTMARVQAARQQIFDFQEIRLKALQTAIAEVRAGHNADSNPGDSAVTDEEQQEIRRIQLMIQNSPDLINAPAGEGIRPTPLITAAMKGQLVVAKYLLDHGADVNGLSGNHGYVPLTAAAENGHKAMVELLLARGADVSGKGLNPFYLAVSKGYLAVAEVLLANRADVNAPSGTDNNRLRPVHVAARDGRTDLLQLLIKNGADVNATAPGWTALGLAAANDNTDAVKLLLDARADFEAKNENGNTALHEAAKTQNAELISLLLQVGATVDSTNREDTTPLMLAVTSNRSNVVRVLLEHKANPDRAGKGTRNFPAPSRVTNAPPVMFAIWSGYDDVLKMLLDAGANPEAGSQYAEPLFDAIDSHHVMAVQLLLDHGANPNARNREGRTPLSFAVDRYRPDQIVAPLLEKGADPNGHDSDERTPLFHVQNIEAARMLIEHKADVNATLADGFTPLMVAQGTTNILTLLLESGAKVDVQNTNGETALHCMVRRSWIDAVSVLLKYKANPNIQNNAGDTPLDLAKAGDVPPSPGVLVAINSDTLNKRKIADLLVQAGGLANLPKRNRIEVRRASQLGTAFTKGSRDWNRYSLLEIIAGEYRLLTQTAEGTWDRNDGARWALWNNDLRFPDFRNIIIYRRTDASAKQKPISVNLEDILNSGDCSRDMWLEWGDVVEIPESDHPVDFRWAGLLNPILTTLTNCLSREVTVVVKGVNSRLKLGPEFSVLTGSNMPDYESVRLTHVSFMLRSVLDNSKLVRVSSDLSRVKVTRVDPETKKKLEWTIDCTKPEQADLWLRDGDVIEVPEK